MAKSQVQSLTRDGRHEVAGIQGMRKDTRDISRFRGHPFFRRRLSDYMNQSGQPPPIKAEKLLGSYLDFLHGVADFHDVETVK